MFRKAFRRLIDLKYGLLVFVSAVAVGSFLLGFWSGSNDSALPGQKTVPLSAEEKEWREKGLAFGDGTYIVGSEIASGIYRTKGTDTSLYGCRFQRLSGLGAENDNVIAGYSEDQGMATIVEIDAGDRAFATEGCGWWYAESVPVAESPTEFSDGAFIVGRDIEPGVYRNSSSAVSGCRWERLSGLSRDFHDARIFGHDEELIVQSRNPVVEIKAADKAFISYKCGRWTLQDL